MFTAVRSKHQQDSTAFTQLLLCLSNAWNRPLLPLAGHELPLTSARAPSIYTEDSLFLLALRALALPRLPLERATCMTGWSDEPAPTVADLRAVSKQQ
jgi:hypothetical protein